MRDDDVHVIREIPPFSILSDEHFDDLFKMAYLQRFPDRVQLIEEGDPADFLHVVVEGTVELFSSLDDREATMFVYRPVSIYNLSAVLNNDVYLVSARTLGNATVLMIPADELRKTMDKDLIFAHAMVKELSKRYGFLISTYRDYRLRNGVERLANYLLRLNKQTSGRGHIELPVDKRTLAALLGMTPEYLSRAFGTLKKHGVEVNGRKISLTNLKRLNRLAKPDQLNDNRAI